MRFLAFGRKINVCKNVVKWAGFEHPDSKEARLKNVQTSQKLPRFFPLAALLLLASCGGGGDTTASVTPPPSPPSGLTQVEPTPLYTVRSGTWVVIGSSTAAGNGAPAGKGWVSVLQTGVQSRGIQFANIAKPATVTYQGLSSASAPVAGRPLPDPTANIDQALSRKPVALIVAYPTNDTVNGYSLDETVNNLMSIRTTALAATVPVMMLSTQPRNLSDAQRVMLKDINASLAAKLGPCFINVFDGIAAPDGRISSAYDSGDGVHPNEAGHKIIASTVQTAIEGGKCIRAVP